MAGPQQQPRARPGRSLRLPLALVLGLLALGGLAALAYLVVLALTGGDIAKFVLRPGGLLHVRWRHNAVLPSLLALAGLLAAIAGWAASARLAAAAAAAEAAAEREREQRERAEERQRALDEERERAERELSQERERAESAERGRSRERRWATHLREEVAELQSRHSPFGDWHDLRALVLQVAVTLLEADKGLLMTRAGDDGDRLELVCAEGFDNDPSESRLVERFAVEVIERDETIKEDDPATLRAERTAPADDEIDNLVAIPIYVRDEFSGVVVCANRHAGFEALEDQVLLSLGDHAGAVLDNSRLHGEARSAFLGTVRMLTAAIEAKDPLLAGHVHDVSRHMLAVGEQLGLDQHRRELLLIASLLHDVGKLGVSERILLKPGKLTREERSAIELHPRIGFHLLGQVPALREVAAAILHHHERWDGEGYPARLAGEQIPLEARIIAVADSFSAMTEQRPYREPVSRDEACRELERRAGTQFDPQVVRVFCEQIRAEGDGPAGPPAEVADAELALRRSGPRFGYDEFAYTDSLTLLYSHRHFHEQAIAEAERAALQSEPFAIVLVELTDLERRNREDGYAAGDADIRRVADAVQAVAARVGATAARYSGRRLGVLLSQEDERGGRALAEEIAGALRGGPAVRVGVSAWRAEDDGDAVIARARAALSHAGAETAR